MRKHYFTLPIYLLSLLITIASCSDGTKPTVEKEVTIGEESIAPKAPVQENRIKETADFNQSQYPSIDIIGKTYEMPKDQNKAIQKMKVYLNEFLSGNYSEQIETEESKFYKVFYNYQPEGFSIFLGYPVNAASTPPKGLAKISVPAGQYGVFEFANSSDSSYYQAWETSNIALELRSFETDLEVYDYDASTKSIEPVELRVKLN